VNGPQAGDYDAGSGPALGTVFGVYRQMIGDDTYLCSWARQKKSWVHSGSGSLPSE